VSSSLWDDLDGPSRVRRFAFDAWRVVEAQHVISTRKLVDSDEEQRLLEDMLDASKPPVPAPARRLHYLLSTSFRYPPLRNGSRFGTRFERGIWYGAMLERTVFAEAAYYRLVFLEGTRAAIARLALDLTAFRASIKTGRGIDLSCPPFAAHAGRISSKTSYLVSQRLGRDMRRDGVAAFRFVSARDGARGLNVGVLDPGAFKSPRPHRLENWHVVATRDAVEISRRDFFRRQSFRFPRSDFLVRGLLPAPAV
jgi:RES domain